MLYSAVTKQSIRNKKWMFFLSRDGRTCFVSDACYHTTTAAAGAARRKAVEMMSSIDLPGLTGNIKFKVIQQQETRT